MSKLRNGNSEYDVALNNIRLLKKYGNFLSNYASYKNNARFNNLLVIYSQLNPNWREEYSKVERRKPKEIRTSIKDKNIKDIIESGQDSDEILESLLSIHAANKVAHACGRSRDIIIKEYLKDKIKSGEIQLAIDDEEKIKYICRIIEKYFDPINVPNEDMLYWAKEKLFGCGIKEENLADLKNLGIEYLSIGQRDGYYIKDLELDRSISLLKEDSEISYGMFTKDMAGSDGKTVLGINGKPRQENIFVVDLPYYGQFSIHLKTMSSISALSTTPYDELRIYEKESVLLTDEVSDWVEQLISGKTLEEFMSDLKKIKNSKENGPRIAHYIAIKMGATKQELDQLYDDNER